MTPSFDEFKRFFDESQDVLSRSKSVTSSSKKVLKNTMLVRFNDFVYATGSFWVIHHLERMLELMITTMSVIRSNLVTSRLSDSSEKQKELLAQLSNDLTRVNYEMARFASCSYVSSKFLQNDAQVLVYSSVLAYTHSYNAFTILSRDLHVSKLLSEYGVNDSNISMITHDWFRA